MWKEATQYAKTAIENYSKQWMPYPYPVASNVNGIEGGMEYPMIVFCHNRTDAQALLQRHRPRVRPHLVPMVVGSNERRYAWMDEGFNSFMNHYNCATRSSPARRSRSAGRSRRPTSRMRSRATRSRS